MLLRATATAARLCALVLVVAALQSFAYVTWLPASLRLFILVVPGAVALWRPFEGLQLIAALIPIATFTVQRFGGLPLPVAEALGLSAIAGLLSRSLWSPLPDLPVSVRMPLYLFGLTVSVSLVTELAALQIQHEDVAAFGASFGRWLTREYFIDRLQYRAVHDAALLLEGLTLFAVTAAVCGTDLRMGSRLRRLVVVGAAAAAILNIERLASAVGRSAAPWDALRVTLEWVRLNVHFGDVNAAGSQFALALFVSAGLALSRRRWPAAWAGFSIVLLAGLWLTGSRAALIAAGMAMLACAAGSLVVLRGSLSWRTAWVALPLLALGGMFIAASPRMVLDADTRRAVMLRAEIVQTSLRMTQSKPVFGIGIGRFYTDFERFSSPPLLAVYSHENAHNNFLQVLSELGAVGLGLFLWVLSTGASALARQVRRVRSAEMAGTAAGLGAFGITMLAGHPLLVPEVAFTFWLILGSAVGYAVSRGTPLAWRSRGLVSAAAALIVFSLVVRVPAARAGADLEHVDYGFSDRRHGPAGERYRVVDGEATFFAPVDRQLTNGIEIPLMAEGPQAAVEFLFDGRAADRQLVASTGWRTVRLSVPPGARRFRRVDIRTNQRVRVGPIKFHHATDLPADPPVRPPPGRADFDGDGRTDIILFRPRTGVWHLKLSSSGFEDSRLAVWGRPGDLPVVGDYDGDGLADTAVYRPATDSWLIQPWGKGEAARITRSWGLPGDIPVPADYDGDGRTDIAVFRPHDGGWYLWLSGSQAMDRRELGVAGDIPVPADYDGDGLDDAAVYRPSEGRWHVMQKSGNRTVPWGRKDDQPLTGDFDGDGTADFAVWRPSTGAWHIASGRTGAMREIVFGRAGDIPAPGNYTGNTGTDIAVWRPETGEWFVSDMPSMDFGRRDDLPVLGVRRGAAAPSIPPAVAPLR